MNNGTMRFDPSPATISQNKSPEAEVTEPPTGNNINLISQRYANGIFYARKETYILKYRQTISVYHRPMAMVGCSKLGYLSAFLFNNK